MASLLDKNLLKNSLLPRPLGSLWARRDNHQGKVFYRNDQTGRLVLLLLDTLTTDLRQTISNRKYYWQTHRMSSKLLQLSVLETV